MSTIWINFKNYFLLISILLLNILSLLLKFFKILSNMEILSFPLFYFAEKKFINLYL